MVGRAAVTGVRGVQFWMPVYNMRPTPDGGWAFEFREHEHWCEDCRELLYWDRLPDSASDTMTR